MHRALVALLALTSLACGPRAAAQDGSSPPPGSEARACTEEAMVCPDGSAVGRTGPDCAFAPCPSGGSGAAAGTPVLPDTGASDGDRSAAPPPLRPCTAPTGCPGPAPAAPNTMCPDGKTMFGPACADIGGGKCEWQIRQCPT